MLSGHVSTVHAYEQTGIGSPSHWWYVLASTAQTIVHNDLQDADVDWSGFAGVIPHIAVQLLQSIVEPDSRFKYFVKVSCIGIYQMRIRGPFQRASDSNMIRTQFI